MSPAASHPEHAETGFLKPAAMQTLAAMGMPAAVIEYVRVQRPLPTWARAVAVAAWICIFLALVFTAVIPLFHLPIAGWLIRAGFFPRDTLLIDLQRYFLVGTIFFAIMLAYVLLTLVTLSRRSLAIRVALSEIQRSANHERDLWMVRRFVKRVDPELPPEEYLVGIQWASIRVASFMAGWILIITLLLASWETLSASYATPQGIKAAGMFARSKWIGWDDVIKLRTGAMDGSRSIPMTRYVVHFPDSYLDLARWQAPTDGKTNLAALAVIDDELRARRVPWEVAEYDFGIYQGRQQWDIAAFRKVRAELPPADQVVFDRVYRFTP